MDFRKIIKFGNSSHVISVPKNWINKHSLKKGDVIYFSENGNNELVIRAKEKEENNPSKSVVINLEGKDFEMVKRYIYSKYLAGYDMLTLLGEQEIRAYEKKLKELLTGMMALEIIEETKNKIVVKDFIDMRAISIRQIIHRMDILIRSMLEDLPTTYKYDKKNLTRRDEGVNRLANIAIRSIKKSVGSPHLQQKMGVSYQDMFKYWDTARFLEHFTDELKRIARFLGESNAKPQMMKNFFVAYKDLEESYIKLMKAWYEGNEELAYKVASASKNVIDKCETLVKKEADVPFHHAVQKMKVMATFIKYLARTVYE